MADRFVVRRTDYGYGIWDTKIDDWWIPRLEMTGMDAQRLAAELNTTAAAEESDAESTEKTGREPGAGDSSVGDGSSAGGGGTEGARSNGPSGAG